MLNDLLLNFNNTLFQIDSLPIFPENIYIYEIKNYQGNFYYDSDRLYKQPKSEINNPLTQLNRTESLLRQLLQSLGFNLSVEASVVFIHPEFTLYQAPLNKPFIYPSQLNHYFKKLNKLNSLKLDQKHMKLADKLLSLHINDSPFTLLPGYEYNQLRKGITCISCNSFSLSISGRTCKCKECGQEETVATAIIRCVDEFRVLFPNKKITTNGIQDWCKVINSKKRIYRVLKGNLQIRGNRQWSFYE
ncbi:nuclease-related domain-containing protein [Metabacillus halosaccharovorans]|uniref:nuclease-related domain-containing protein n=1 Tax=Metabacillus halosaccharovorans TaxID=930124 RepID=UPI0031F8F233